MKLAIRNIRVWQEDGTFRTGELYVENGRFSAPFASDTVFDGEGALAFPGLLDIHTHGRAGADFCNADEAQLHTAARAYAENGVTSVLATLASDTTEGWRAALARIGNAADPVFFGIHMEGSWLSPARRGAHAPHLLRTPDAAELRALTAASPLSIRKVTYAPELDGEGTFAAACRDLGVVQSVGHTDADYAIAAAALARGATSFTHLYNAMPPLHHRAGGPVAAALGSDAYAELIVDGHHVAPEVVALTYRIKGADRLILISDSMMGTGCADGLYSIAGLPVHMKDGVALTEEGKLAGSTLSLLRGVQNLASFCGIPFGEALTCATLTPAVSLGIADERGTLREGAFADLVLLQNENDPHPARVLLHGEWL